MTASTGLSPFPPSIRPTTFVALVKYDDLFSPSLSLSTAPHLPPPFPPPPPASGSPPSQLGFPSGVPARADGSAETPGSSWQIQVWAAERADRHGCRQSGTGHSLGKCFSSHADAAAAANCKLFDLQQSGSTTILLYSIVLLTLIRYG